jgi:hypothetical protein
MKRDKKSKSVEKSENDEANDSIIYMQFTWAMRRYIARRLQHFAKSGERGSEIVSQIARHSRTRESVNEQFLLDSMPKVLVENQKLLEALVELFGMDRPCNSLVGNKTFCSWLTTAQKV